MRKHVVLIAVLALCGCAPQHDDIGLLLSLTPEHFRDTAQITDDPLETTAVISMEPGYQGNNNARRDGWSCNSFLRAFVDKRSGATTYQLYADTGYTGHDRRLYDTINYFTPQGVQSAPVIKIARDKGSCPKNDACVHKEIVGFNMSESMVRQIAATYAPNAKNGWAFRLKGRIVGADQEDAIMPSEAAGLLLAVQAYRASGHQ
jgi:hypothetical protein